MLIRLIPAQISLESISSFMSVLSSYIIRVRSSKSCPLKFICRQSDASDRCGVCPLSEGSVRILAVVLFFIGVSSCMVRSGEVGQQKDVQVVDAYDLDRIRKILGDLCPAKDCFGADLQPVMTKVYRPTKYHTYSGKEDNAPKESEQFFSLSLKGNPNLKSVAVQVLFSDVALTWLHDRCFVKEVPVYSKVIKSNRAYFKRDHVDSFTLFLKPDDDDVAGVKIKSGGRKIVFSTSIDELSPTTDIVFWIAKDNRLKIGAINGKKPGKVYSEVFLTVNGKCNDVVEDLSYTKDHVTQTVSYHGVYP